MKLLGMSHVHPLATKVTKVMSFGQRNSHFLISHCARCRKWSGRTRGWTTLG